MLRVIVEVVPGGDERRKYTLDTIEIANVTECAPLSDYAFTTASGAIGDIYRHECSNGWTALVRRVLTALGDGYGR